MNRRNNEKPQHLVIWLAVTFVVGLGVVKFFSQNSPVAIENREEPQALFKHVGQDENEITESDADDDLIVGSTSLASQIEVSKESTKALPTSGGGSNGLPVAKSELYEFLNQVDPKAEWVLTKNQDQKISAISGGAIKLPIKLSNGEINTKAELAAHLAELTGTPSEQISKTESPLPETSFSRTVQFQQIYNGYKVDQSFVRMTERKSDGAIFYSNFENHELGEPDLRKSRSLDEAKELALARYSQSASGVIKTLPEPVIFVSAPQKSELAWVVFLKVTGPRYDERRLTVSAVSGQILQDISALQH